MFISADMREGLGEIAEQPPARGIVVFGEQPDIVADRKEPLEQGSRIAMAADHGVVVGEPEAAGEERPLARR